MGNDCKKNLVPRQASTEVICLNWKQFKFISLSINIFFLQFFPTPSSIMSFFLYLCKIELICFTTVFAFSSLLNCQNMNWQALHIEISFKHFFSGRGHQNYMRGKWYLIGWLNFW